MRPFLSHGTMKSPGFTRVEPGRSRKVRNGIRIGTGCVRPLRHLELRSLALRSLNDPDFLLLANGIGSGRSCVVAELHSREITSAPSEDGGPL